LRAAEQIADVLAFFAICFLFRPVVIVLVRTLV